MKEAKIIKDNNIEVIAKNNKAIRFLYLIFFISFFTLLLNLLFLFNWVDRYWEIAGKYDGRGYTIRYYFMHISYISLILILIWSYTELIWRTNFKIEKDWQKIFNFRYFAISWSIIVFFIFIWIYPQFLYTDIKNIISGNNNYEGWTDDVGISFIAYSFVNILQVTMIHILIPIIVFLFFIFYGKPPGKISVKSLKYFLIYSDIFMLIYYFATALATMDGYKAPYIFIDFGNVHINDWSLAYWMQIFIAVAFLSLYNIFNILLYKLWNKKLV